MARKPLRPEDRKRWSLTPFEKDWEARHEHARHEGLHWRDMPGNEYQMKKLNWFLWRRGMYVEEMDVLAPNRWVNNMGANVRKRVRALSEERMAAEIAAALED